MLLLQVVHQILILTDSICVIKSHPSEKTMLTGLHGTKGTKWSLIFEMIAMVADDKEDDLWRRRQ